MTLQRSVCVACFVLLLAVLRLDGLQAQQGTVQGEITDSRTLAPISAVQVFLPGLGLGTLSDEQGEYTLTNVPPGEHELRAEMIGRAPLSQTITVGPAAVLTVNFSLETSAIGLDEIVVTGTVGRQVRRSLGNVVGRVDAAALQRSSAASDIEQLLLGATPGLSVDVGNNSAANSGSNIRIRGVGSMALSSQPLLYVDGVRVNNDPPTRNRVYSGHFPPSRFQDLNPEDIESIEVIKGPAAATLYGTEASNGVINIITKKGVIGAAPQFDLRVGQGVVWLPDPENQWSNTAYRCRGISTKCTPGEVVRFNVLREDRIRNGAEWFRTGLPQLYGASIQGGIANLRYFTSVDYDDNEGITVADWRKKISGRANLTWTPSENLDIQFGMGHTRSRSRLDSHSGIIGLQWACPNPGCEEGSGAIAVDGIFRGYFARLPMMYMDHDFIFENLNRTNYNFTVTHRPTSWLTHRFVTGADWTQIEDSRRTDAGLPGGIDVISGLKRVQNLDTDYLSADYSITAAFDVTPDFSASTSVGVQYNRKKFHDVFAEGRDFAVDKLETISAGGRLRATEEFLENKTIGAFVQEQLSWQDRLYLTVAVRGDDNSAFGKNFDFVTYPKVSASWVLSEEAFMVGMMDRGLNELRLRAAWGKAGQQPDVFAAVRTYGPVPGPGGTTGLSPKNLGNPDVRPEVGEEIEIGFDASLFDRLSLEFTFYNQSRKDALVVVPARQSLGFPGNLFQNLGEVRNRGFEVGLSAASVVETGGVGLDLSLNLTTNDNEVTDLGGLPPQIMRGGFAHSGWTQQLYAEGFPLGAMFMKNVVSANVEGSGASARGVNVMCEGGSILPISSPGYPISLGGGSPVPCADAPNVYIGATKPTIELSFTPTLRLGDRIRISTQVDYVDGHTMIDGPVAGNHLFYRNSVAITERQDPILLGYESLSVAGLNQVGLFDAGIVRMRRLSATVDFPGDWAQQFRADNMSFTVSASNPWLIWRAQSEIFGNKIVEPEASYTYQAGNDPSGLSAYVQNQSPSAQRIMAVLRVGF